MTGKPRLNRASVRSRLVAAGGEITFRVDDEPLEVFGVLDKMDRAREVELVRHGPEGWTYRLTAATPASGPPDQSLGT